MKSPLCLILLITASFGGSVCADDLPKVINDPPNIIWIIAEDQSRHYGCYGEKLVTTPTIDRLAAEGVKFTNATVTAPVCSASRSALMTGMSQTSIGAHHHRSGRGTEKILLPEHIKLIPQIFHDEGYFTTLGTFETVMNYGEKKTFGKSDYNFEWDESIYDSNDWRFALDDQPFFAQIMLAGGKARNQARNTNEIPHVKASDVTLPPYYPRHPEILEDWAAYLDTFTLMDRQVEKILARLHNENLLDNTIIFFMTDHGVSHARGKQYLYDEGIMVPLIVYGKRWIPQGMVRDDLVAQIDVAATSLKFAGIPLPEYLEARPLFEGHEDREFVVSARDRCDETYDRIRSVRTHDFKYIRNGYPERPHLSPNVYKDEKEIYKALRQWHLAGKLDDLQERLLFSPTRSPEELYDLRNDPWELNNLAQDPQYQMQLDTLRSRLDDWIKTTGDQGQHVEPMTMYDSDMQAYIKQISRRQPERAKLIKKNVEQMKTWWSEGK